MSLASDVISCADTSMAYMDQELFRRFRSEPFTLARGNVESNLLALKDRGGSIADETNVEDSLVPTARCVPSS